MRLALILTLTCAIGLPAQESNSNSRSPIQEKPAPRPFGTVHVKVRDAKGAPMAGAMVAIEKLERSHESSETGDVLLGWVPVGKHEVKVSKAGFRTVVVPVQSTAEGISVVTAQLAAEPK